MLIHAETRQTNIDINFKYYKKTKDTWHLVHLVYVFLDGNVFSLAHKYFKLGLIIVLVKNFKICVGQSHEIP